MAKQVCSVADCERWCFGHGFCERHYSRWRKHGDPLGGGPDRGTFHAYVERVLGQDVDGCIEWPGNKCSNGYGRITLGGRQWLVHRLICERTNGAPASKNLHAAHSCGNSSCVNWKHIRWATAKENARDKRAHGTNGRKLNIAEVILIRGSGMSRDILATEFGITPHMVTAIRSGRAWAEHES